MHKMTSITTADNQEPIVILKEEETKQKKAIVILVQIDMINGLFLFSLLITRVLLLDPKSSLVPIFQTTKIVEGPKSKNSQK